MDSIKIKSSYKNYFVEFNNDFSFFEPFGNLKSKAIIVDQKVFEIYQSVFDKYFDESDLFLFEATEFFKTLRGAEAIFEFLIKKNIRRNSTLLSVGGGITQDITGFVASTYYRGIEWTFVPTTFLAQTDSCIGSKTSLNFQSMKNLIGTFYPPTKLIINVNFLKTLKEDDYFSGVGEVIKLQLMGGEKDPKKLLSKIKLCKDSNEQTSNLIKENLLIKKTYLEEDEFDLGSRKLLNYGHCYGHALESISNYSISHGIAVNLGMIFANFLSLVKFGNDNLDYFLNQFKVLHLPFIKSPLKKEYFDPDKIIACLKNDKKKIGSDHTFVMPSSDNYSLEVVNSISDIDIYNTSEIMGRYFGF